MREEKAERKELIMFPYTIAGVLTFLFILLSLEPFLIAPSNADDPDRSLATEKIRIPSVDYDVTTRAQKRQ
jgi:hypothetical protein